MDVLVTGCAGFIGSSLADALVARGDGVVGLDNLDPLYDPTLKRANLRGLLAADSFRLVEGDIRDEALVARTVADHRPDAIIHLAALTGVRPSLDRPREYTSVNVDGTVALLEAARRAGVPRFVFASSSSVYGSSNQLPFRESQPVGRPVSPYAASKSSGEAFCHAFHQMTGMSVAVLRFFTVYGPRQRPDMAISRFVRLMLAGESVPMYGDGSSSRDYTYVDDTVAGIIAAVDASVAFEVVNLGGSEPITLRALVATIGETLSCVPKAEQLPDQPGDVPCTYADTSKAKQLLGWAPKVALEEGLRRFAEWHRGAASSCGSG